MYASFAEKEMKKKHIKDDLIRKKKVEIKFKIYIIHMVMYNIYTWSCPPSFWKLRNILVFGSTKYICQIILATRLYQ